MLKTWPSGLVEGDHLDLAELAGTSGTQVADFLANVAGNKSTSPTFREALETTRICDAVLASAKVGAWKDVAPNAR